MPMALPAAGATPSPDVVILYFYRFTRFRGLFQFNDMYVANVAFVSVALKACFKEYISICFIYFQRYVLCVCVCFHMHVAIVLSMLHKLDI